VRSRMRCLEASAVDIPGAPWNPFMRNVVPPGLLPAVPPHAVKPELLRDFQEVVIDPAPCDNLRPCPRIMLLQYTPAILECFFETLLRRLRFVGIIVRLQNHVVTVLFVPAAYAVCEHRCGSRIYDPRDGNAMLMRDCGRAVDAVNGDALPPALV